MFEEIRNTRRIPSAHSMQQREDYLDKVLGKLPEIQNQKTAKNLGQQSGTSEGSTTAMTNTPPRVKVEVHGVDGNNDEEEETYW